MNEPYPTFPYPASNHQPHAGSHTPVADALALVDQAGTEYGVPSAELRALRMLAAAVRSHGIGAELGQLREQSTVTEAELAAREA